MPPLTSRKSVTQPEFTHSRPSLGDWVTLLRPRQWIKNLVVFAGLMFTGEFNRVPALLAVLAVFAIFCALSSFGYIINDVADRERDRVHPVKCRRPIAAGRITPTAALSMAVVLLLGATAGAYLLGWQVVLVAGLYLAVTLSYSWVWKHQVILDIMAITGGFLVRALAGTAVLGVSLSPWLFVCLSFLALLLGFGKRRHEVRMLCEDAAHHRPVLANYTQAFCDQMTMMMAASAIITYALYAITSPAAQLHPSLIYTVPLVLYAIIRYLFLIQQCDQGGQPEEIFLTDRPILISIVLWAAAIGGILIYR